MGRQPCCERLGLKRGPWTIEEDNKLMNFILNNGIQCWRLVPKLAGLTRCGKSCRLRWINYLRPDLKRGGFTEAEEDMIIELHSRLGNRWSKIAAHFPGRTDNEIKNHWNTRIKKKMKLMGLDPLTHKPIELKAQTSTGESEETQMEPSENFSPDPTTMYQMEHKTEGNLFSGPNQNNMGSYNKTSGMESSIMFQNVLNQNQVQSNMMINTMDIGSSLVSKHMDGFVDLPFDPFQNWMDQPLPWDGYSHFQDIFP